MPGAQKDDEDVDALDEGWGEDGGSGSDDDEDDVDSLAGGWDDGPLSKSHRTAAEKARARREKAWLKAQKRKEHAARTAAKQKQKQPKARSVEEPGDDAPDPVVGPDDSGRAAPAKKRKRAAPPAKPAGFTRATWIAVAVIAAVTVAALVYALR